MYILLQKMLKTLDLLRLLLLKSELRCLLQNLICLFLITIKTKCLLNIMSQVALSHSIL